MVMNLLDRPLNESGFMNPWDAIAAYDWGDSQLYVYPHRNIHILVLKSDILNKDEIRILKQDTRRTK